MAPTPAAADTRSEFVATVRRPRDMADAAGPWAFVAIPKAASDKLPRRGRTTVDGRIGGTAFRATLEPDGRLGHWLRLDAALLRAARVQAGDEVAMAIEAVDPEPEPALPEDLARALSDHPGALVNWEATTTLARLDWIHWIQSAKQAKTRAKRVADACGMLAEGKRRVCCFDVSGFYSKAFRLPDATE